MYFILGGLFVGIQLLIRYKLSQMGKAKLWPNCSLTLIANALLILAIAWAYASVLEHEMQAAMMGLLVFGGTGVIFGIMAYKVITKPESKKVKAK